MSDASDGLEGAPVATDRELIQAMRLGSSDVFRMLFHRHSPAVHDFVRAGLVNHGDIDDVLQEVFVTAWLKLDAKQMSGDSALPWILVTARNLVSNANRKRAKHEALEGMSKDSTGIDNTFDSIVRSEESGALRIALNRLDPLDLRIVVLCLQQGMLYKEAARETKSTTGVVRNRLSRARRFLRGELEPLRGDGLGR